jgi:hypothetical protein
MLPRLGPARFVASCIRQQNLVRDRGPPGWGVVCVVGCRRLLRREAILAGGSSGAAIMALERVRQELPEGVTCVAILADRGERYLDTIYSDAWVSDHFGDVADLWQE